MGFFLVVQCVFLWLGVSGTNVTSDDSEAVPLSGSSPRVMEIVSQDDVSLLQFTGLWYEISRGPYSPQFAGVHSVIRYMALGKDMRSLTGYYAGTLNGTCLPAFKGEIQLFCDGGPADFFARGITMASQWGITKIIYSDYQNSILYFCPALNEDGTCRDGGMATIISRTKSIHSDIESHLIQILQNRTGIVKEEMEPVEYYDDCFPSVLAAVDAESEVNNCAFRNIETQGDFDAEKFSGKWYPVVAQKFSARTELVNNPICYRSLGEGGLAVSFVAVWGDVCRSTDPFNIYPRCRRAQNGDFLVSRGRPVTRGDPVHSLFKIVYTDYEVAVGVGCLGVLPDGRCIPTLSGAAIVSRTPSVSAETLDFLYDVARNACIDVTLLEETQMSEDAVSCDCPDNEGTEITTKIDEISTKPEEGKGFEHSNSILKVVLGTWYGLTFTSGTFDADSYVDTPPTAVHYRLGPGGTLLSSTVLSHSLNGTCAPPISSTEEVLCPNERLGQLSFVRDGSNASWYSYRITYVDSEVLITSLCSDFNQCSNKQPTYRVYQRVPSQNNNTEAKVADILRKFGINGSMLNWDDIEDECSELLYTHPVEPDESSCRTANFPVHENFSVSALAGRWHVLAHFSQMNGSVTKVQAATLHYQDHGDSEMSGFVTGSTATGDCLPLLRNRVLPRCGGATDGAMWTEEVGGIFSPGAPLQLSATWKAIYLDQDNAIVYSCSLERLDGTCAEENARASILGRKFEISEQRFAFLREQVARTCINVANLHNSSAVTSDACLKRLEDGLARL